MHTRPGLRVSDNFLFEVMEKTQDSPLRWMARNVRTLLSKMESVEKKLAAQFIHVAIVAQKNTMDALRQQIRSHDDVLVSFENMFSSQRSSIGALQQQIDHHGNVLDDTFKTFIGTTIDDRLGDDEVERFDIAGSGASSTDARPLGWIDDVPGDDVPGD